MPSGDTTTAALTDSLDDIRASARIVREYEGVMPQLVDKVTLGEGVGLSWNEVSYDQIVASAVTESTRSSNPQQLVDSLITITPTVSQISVLLTDRVAARLNRKGYSKLGGLAMNAIQRKKDEDGLTTLDGATTSLSGAGTTLTSGVIAAASYRITSNATEPGNDPIRTVLHGFQIKDIHDEITAGVGTYPVGEGLTARVFAEKFRGMLAGSQVYEDGNIAIDSSDDSKGGTFAQEGLVLVQGRSPKTVPVRREEIGGGSTEIFVRDEYAYGERSAGNWLYEIYSDALAPTS